MISKKALTASFLIGMMITLVAFILISGTLIRLFADSDDLAAENLCQESVALRAQTAVYVKGDLGEAEVKLVPPLCKTIDKEVSGSRTQIMRQIADSMARCWWMFGEGRYEEILDDIDVDVFPSVLGFQNTENQCFNCYTILVDKDDLQDGPITPTEMYTFMQEKNYSKVNKAYLNYIQTHGGPGRAMFTAPGIVAGEAYAISLAPKNKDVKDSEFWKGVGNVATGVVIGAVVIGAVACVAFTGGACVAAIVGAGSAGAAGAAATGAVTAVAVKTGSVAAAGALTYASFSGYAGFKQIMSTLYGERDVSTVMFGYLDVAQEHCGSSDLAGE